MKANKKIIYLLLLSVFVIWGVIVYRIFGSINSNDRIMNDNLDTFKQTSFKNDSFTIINSYPDPFLSIDVIKSQPKKQVSIKKGDGNKDLDNEIKKIESSIVYKGYVLSKNKSVKSAMIQVEKKDFFVTLNSRIQNFLIFSITSDSIGILSDSKVRLFIKRKSNSPSVSSN